MDLLAISWIIQTYTETIPGLYRGPPQDKGWDEYEQTKSENESKRKRKSVRPEKERNNEIKINKNTIKMKYTV